MFGPEVVDQPLSVEEEGVDRDRVTF